MSLRVGDKRKDPIGPSDRGKVGVGVGVGLNRESNGLDVKAEVVLDRTETSTRGN